VQADPLVQNVLARFPGAQIVAVRQPEPDLQQPLPAEEDEEPAPPLDDDGSAFGAYGRRDDVDDH
jgi:DNA polymerase III subunit gamma/tau